MKDLVTHCSQLVTSLRSLSTLSLFYLVGSFLRVRYPWIMVAASLTKVGMNQQ